MLIILFVFTTCSFGRRGGGGRPESARQVRYLGLTCLRHRAVFRDVKMQAEVGGPLREAVETELEFIRAEGCDEGFSGEVRYIYLPAWVYMHANTTYVYKNFCVQIRPIRSWSPSLLQYRVGVCTGGRMG